MRRVLTAAAAVSILLCAASAQGAGWSRRYAPHQSETHAVAPLPQNGFLLLTAGNPWAVIAVNAAGEVRAARSVGSTSAMTTTPSGSTFLLRNDGQGGIELTKLKADLTLAWARRLTPSGSGSLSAGGTSDDGVVVLTEDRNAAVVTKLRADGSTQWVVRLEGARAFRVREVRGTLVLAGTCRTVPWLAVLTAEGVVRWQRTYSVYGSFRDVAPAPDGGLFAAGQAGQVMLAVRMTADGEVVWARTSTGTIAARAVATTSQGWAIGTRGTQDTQTVVLFVDPAGALRWQRMIYRPASAIANKDVESMLAGANDGAAFVNPYPDRAPLLFRFEAATGVSGCSWFTESDVALRDLHVTAERVPLLPASGTIGNAPFTAKAPAALVLKAGPAPCPPGPAPRPKPAGSDVPLSDFDERPKGLEEMAQRLIESWRERDFDAVEAAAAAARAARPADPARPHRDVDMFYEIITMLPEAETLELTAAWVAARPQSIPARLARVKALRNAAWRQRSEHAKLIGEASKLMTALGRSAENDPFYWRLATSMAGETGGDVRAVARRGLGIFADPEIATNAGIYLHPQWGRSTKELLAFAEEAVRITRPVYGDALYMILGLQLLRSAAPAEKATLGLDWPRIKRAADELVKKDPKWLPTYHRLAWAAYHLNDRAAAKALFERPELAWYGTAEEVWTSRANYAEVRKWALTGEEAWSRPKPPAAPTPAAPTQTRPSPRTWPQVLFETELRFGGQVHRRISAFLVQAKQGVVAVSALPGSSGMGLDRDETRVAEVMRTFGGWTLTAPHDRQQVLRATAILAAKPSPQQHGVSIAVKPPAGKWPVGILEPLPAGREPDLQKLVFVIACRWTQSGGCEQTAYEAEIIGSAAGGASKYRTFTLGLPEGVNGKLLGGAAVVTGDGYVFAVANGLLSGAAYGHVSSAGAEDIRQLLP